MRALFLALSASTKLDTSFSASLRFCERWRLCSPRESIFFLNSGIIVHSSEPPGRCASQNRESWHDRHSSRASVSMNFSILLTRFCSFATLSWKDSSCGVALVVVAMTVRTSPLCFTNRIPTTAAQATNQTKLFFEICILIGCSVCRRLQAPSYQKPFWLAATPLLGPHAAA